MIDVDKTEHDLFNVTFIAHSSNNGDIPTFIFCSAYYITSIKQWESKNIIRTLLLQPWLWVTYQHDEVDKHPFLTKSIGVKLLNKQ